MDIHFPIFRFLRAFLRIVVPSWFSFLPIPTAIRPSAVRISSFSPL
ncbi:hypothetical protein PLANPX_0104 [Lacipirellula parvula]|uniref:Uncharacterized protein n=1 Tax=Lacipirellula parvula TaxID=2650471 RepID=A0A5K7X3U0_9BACT|nr:hypothetical protein PLANPX_0104 [Lacipirellula parvula]